MKKIHKRTMTDELKMLRGDYGDSVVNKLGLEDNASIEDMLAKVDERLTAWNDLYSIARLRNPKDAEACKILTDAYRSLKKGIGEMAQKHKEAVKALYEVQEYFYGKKL